MVALMILALIVVGSTVGWGFVARTERVNSIQAELDIDVRNAMEKLKRDLRLTSMDKVYFYPPGPGPYSAMSFPIAIPGTNGLVPTDAGGYIIWGQTVVYHVWTSTPYRLLRTVFDPRDNSLTDTQLVDQLTSVVTHGNGEHTYSSAGARTASVFENLFTWSINGKGSTYDAYNSTLDWDPGISFGSILLTGGTHQVKFSVVGKNAASGGYQVGVDTIVMSPCAIEREAEAQLPVASQTGATARADYVAGGSWSGNHQLLFPATKTNQSFTLSMDNDRWEETNFRGAGALCRKTTVEFDQTLTPYDFICRLEGYGYAWTPDFQTGSSNAVNDAFDTLQNSCGRVLVRGSTLVNKGGTIQFSGMTHYVLFSASSAGPLNIKAAYIALAADQTNVSPNAASVGTPLYFSHTQYSGPYDLVTVNIPAGNSWWCCPASNYEIDATKSYVISFAVAGAGKAVYWPETHSGVPGTYTLAVGADASVAAAANWSSLGPATTPNLFAVAGIYTTYPTNGTFTSQAFDTQMTAPVYGTLSWNADTPSGTSLKFKVRTGSSQNMSDAADWSAVTNMTTAGAITAASKRFVQFQAILNPDTSGWSTPRLKDVTLRWAGGTRMVDVGATMTRGTNYGICEVTVDGKALTKGMTIDLTIFQDITGWAQKTKRLTSGMTAEVDPRNTGM